MKATITLRVHGIDALSNAVRIAELTRLLSELYGATPSVNENDMLVSFETDSFLTDMRQIEALQPILARSFSTRLWLSVAVQEVQE